MINLRWFNWSAPEIPIRGRYGAFAYIWLWTIFNRVSQDGHFWGIGMLQIQNRALFYVGYNGVSIAFIGRLC